MKDVDVAYKMVQLHQSAKSRNLEFDLSFRMVRELLLATRCYYTATVFEEDGPNSKTIDRVDSSRGYVDDNVVACTMDINQKKSNLSLRDAEVIYRGMLVKKVRRGSEGDPAPARASEAKTEGTNKEPSKEPNKEPVKELSKSAKRRIKRKKAKASPEGPRAHAEGLDVPSDISE